MDGNGLLPDHTIQGLRFTFSDTEASLCLGETPLVSFPLTILDYRGWTYRSAEESLEGVAVDLEVPQDGDPLYLEGRLLSITRITMSEEITNLNGVPFWKCI